jgi:hypothetical protein
MVVGELNDAPWPTVLRGIQVIPLDRGHGLSGRSPCSAIRDADDVRTEVLQGIADVPHHPARPLRRGGLVPGGIFHSFSSLRNRQTGKILSHQGFSVRPWMNDDLGILEELAVNIGHDDGVLRPAINVI